MMTVEGNYDEALERFHATGPEFQGWLSNHGPMVIEAMDRRGAGGRIHRWTDDYLDRLEDRPRSLFPIGPDEWRDPLGDPARTGDWIDYFLKEIREQPWSDVVALWWPRLLPGIAAGATHGVIRVGHALRSIREEDTQPRRDEVAHALAYWAARWQPVPVVSAAGQRRPADLDDLIGAIPAIPDQRFGIRFRLRQLGDTPGFAATAAQLARPTQTADVPGALAQVVDAAVAAYPRLAHGNATMLVHAATAPNAVLLALPSLPERLWPDSFDAAWTATAAVVAAYRPAEPAPAPQPRDGADDSWAHDSWERAVADGGEHIVKLADTALSAVECTGDLIGLAAIDTAIRLEA